MLELHPLPKNEAEKVFIPKTTINLDPYMKLLRECVGGVCTA